MREYPVVFTKAGLTYSMTPSRSQMKMESALCSTALERRRISCSDRRRAVTSRSTTTPPVSSPESSRKGVPIALSQMPSGRRALRTKISSSSATSPRIARARGSSSSG